MPVSSSRRRVLCVFGTRPDAVKMAPVVLELQRRCEAFETRIVVTGQHREQLDQILCGFGLRPDRDLAIMQHGQSLAAITTRALNGLEEEISTSPADILLAQGDTTTTLVAGLAAFYHKVAFGHVEAGLRTHNRYDPFPEEMNRRLATALATWHFAPTEEARANLLAEGIDPASVTVTGNTSIDALRLAAGSASPIQDAGLRSIAAQPGRLLLVTAHRRENWGEPMERIGRAIAQIAARFTDVYVVVALHKNPQVRERLSTALSAQPRVYMVEPPDYHDFVRLMKSATLILTDSGGVQEEAPALGVPVLVLRCTTERPEAVSAGASRLVGTEIDGIVAAATELLTSQAARQAMSSAGSPYGDGHAACRIADVLARDGKAP